MPAGPLAVLLVALAAASVILGGLVLLLAGRLASRLRALDGPGEAAAALALMQQQVDSLRAEVSRSLESQAGLLDRRIAETSRTVSERLEASGRTVGERLDAVARTVGELRQQVGQVQEAGQKIFDVGRSIATLQEILRSPKLRGGLGETFLGEILGQVLPEDAYELQHTFRSGSIVDALIRAGRHTIPVDAKFPLENFQRMACATDEAQRASCRRAFVADVRRHIDSIGQKYIRPDEGTLDFALMYIPAENVYYETILRDQASAGGAANDLFEHALSRRVVPVSPNSLYAYLQVILLGLKGMRVEEAARQIASGLERLRGDLGRFRETFDLVGRHLGNAASQQEKANRQLDRLEDGVEILRLSPAASPELDEVAGGGGRGSGSEGAA